MRRPTRRQRRMRAAMFQIVLADLSMSLDNVLAVAGAAREHPWVLVLGLAISVVLMGVGREPGGAACSSATAGWRGSGWRSCCISPCKMIWEGSHEIAAEVISRLRIDHYAVAAPWCSRG